MKYLILWCSFAVFAQQKQSVYFDYNEFKLNTSQTKDLENWLAQNPDIEIVALKGYCDTVGGSIYNFELSDKRVETVLKIVEKKVKISKQLALKGFGKDFEQDNIQDKNRRVDIFFESAEGAKFKTALVQAAIGDKIKIPSLNFYNNSGKVLPESEPTLKRLLEIMTQNPALKIEIQGHICCRTGVDVDDIAKVRAVSVYDFLVQNGISKTRLQYKSFGSTAPIYPLPEKNEQERIANRRVEIMILDK